MRSSFWLAAFIVIGCRSTESNVAPTNTPPAPPPVVSSAPPVAKKGPTKIDRFFQPMVEKLPSPATLSEGNGASNRCAKHGGVTYTLLYAQSEKVPIASDADLVDLVPWLRHEDQCLRQIALDALVPKIGFDRNRLVIPNMHEVDNHLYHWIFVAFRAQLDKKHVAYSPAIFEGMMLDPNDAEFTPLLAGKWEEEFNSHKNFRAFVKLENNQLAVTDHEMHDDPKWPDHTQTSEIREAKVNAQKQFVVTGKWRVESNAKGYVGQKIEPSDITYRFWPISRDVIWFDEGRDNNWIKLIRRP